MLSFVDGCFRESVIARWIQNRSNTYYTTREDQQYLLLLSLRDCNTFRISSHSNFHSDDSLLYAAVNGNL